jgi:hypothetical protein
MYRPGALSMSAAAAGNRVLPASSRDAEAQSHQSAAIQAVASGGPKKKGRHFLPRIMLRAQRMTALSKRLALLIQSLTLPEDVTLAVDIDPVDLA